MAIPEYRVNGPCEIAFAGLTLGKCKEPIVIRPKVTWNPILVDGFGTAPAGYIFGGRSAIVECILSEAAPTRGFTELTQNLFPNGLFSLLTSEVTDPLVVGQLASAIAAILTITEVDDGGGPYLWTAPKAVILDPAELVLTATTEQQFPLSFLLIPDQTSSNKLFTTIPSYIV